MTRLHEAISHFRSLDEYKERPTFFKRTSSTAQKVRGNVAKVRDVRPAGQAAAKERAQGQAMRAKQDARREAMKRLNKGPVNANQHHAGR